MNLAKLQKRIFPVFFLFVLSAGAAAQETEKKAEKVDENTADVAITANVTAKELKFEIVPNPDVKFPGTPARRTEWSAERENLPDSVQPNVIYRDIGIRLKITSVFADIEKIVDEALGIVSAETGKTTETTETAETAEKVEKAKADETAGAGQVTSNEKEKIDREKTKRKP